MSYYDLPTKKKQAAVTIGITVVYGVSFYFMKTSFPELTDEIKMYLTQFGLMVIFVSGVLAGISFFWSGKVRHNREFAIKEIEISNENIEILNSMREQLKTDFSSSLNINNKRLMEAQRNLKQANEHPEFIRFSGGLSLVFLGVGTLMCVVGAG